MPSHSTPSTAPTARPSTATPKAWSSRCSTTARSSSRAPGKSSPTCCPGTPSKERSRAATCCTAGFPASTFPSARRRRKITSSNWCNSSPRAATVCIQTDGRNPALLERLIGLNALAKVQLNIPGPASVYEALYGSAPTKDELAKTIELVKAFPDHEIRFLATPLSGPEGARWPNRDEAGEAARMVFEACGDHQLPYAIAAVTPEMPQGMQGLDPVPDPMMLKYRSASREFLFKADIAK